MVSVFKPTRAQILSAPHKLEPHPGNFAAMINHDLHDSFHGSLPDLAGTLNRAILQIVKSLRACSWDRSRQPELGVGRADTQTLPSD